MSINRWNLDPIDKEIVDTYARKWNISHICAAILYRRGFRENKDIYEFLNCSDSLNPFDFKDMQKAIDILNRSIKNSEKICIYGDYDADGITATALLYSYFKSKTQNVIYYIPNRETEGYGLNCHAIEKLNDLGIKIILTVDNGIAAYEEIKYANSLGIKVIITDHHSLPKRLPEAEAIINPCAEDWYEKGKSFAGVGVAYKVVEAMENADSYLDLALIGTIGDSMPLFGQSRTIVKKGMQSISNSKIQGIKTLIQTLNLGTNIDSVDLAFKVVPRINASGRMKTADTALKLLVSEDKAECEKLCTYLEDLNILRKETEKEITLAVEEKIKQDSSKKFQNIIIVEGEDWHHGVIGIVASRITQKYGKPCILISYSRLDGLARGSCRSVEGFSIYEAISQCSKYLERFGGHTMAAGINLKLENIKGFSEAVLEISKNYDICFPKIDIDEQISGPLISTETLNQLECLKPFGSENPEPIFLVKDVTLKRIVPIGKGNHLKLIFDDKGFPIEMLYFNKTSKNFLYKEREKLDVLITLHSNVYKSKNTVSAYVEDLKLSEINLNEVLNQKKLYEKFKRRELLNSEELNSLLPNREEFAKVYVFLKKSSWLRVDIVSYKVFGDNAHCAKIYVILDVFESMGLISLTWDSDEFCVSINKCNKKVNLEESPVLISLNEINRRIRI